MKLRLFPLLAVLGALGFGACGGADEEAGPTSDSGTDAPTVGDAGWTPGDGAADAPGPDADSGPTPTPATRAPCDIGQCYPAPSLSSYCGSSTVNEDFSTGKYNVHEYALLLPAGDQVDLTLDVTGGSWTPALIVNADDGTTLYDGEVGTSGAVQATSVSTGRGETTAHVTLLAQSDTPVTVFVTGWAVVDGDFSPSLPTDATYDLKTDVDCAPVPPGTLLSPPNFDPNKTQNGFFLLPDSEPPGLYIHKADACSWGTKLLIDVIYTVATKWKSAYPSLSPLSVRDMNENVAVCGTDHQTHDDGTHVDIVAGCATDINCTDKAPKIALAKLFVDTGVACGILNNDTTVQPIVNDYFAQKTNYAPWKGQFMRSVTGHTLHFHVRVKKPDGTCN